MPLFAFKSNNHFVTSSDGAILQVHELAKSSDHLSSIQKSDWKKVATISPGLDDDDMSYNGLLFFDGHGRIKGRIALTMLAQHLKQLHLLVSPEGYCFQEVSEIGTHPDFGIHYLRLNDLFSWPRHEVDLVTINVWSRLELKYSLPKYKSTTSTTIIGGRVSKEKYAELEKLVKEKDKELEKLKEEMDEAIEENEAKEEELQKLKQADEEHQKQNMGEMQRQLKKKDDELHSLKKKKDEEDEEKAQKENKAKDEELQMLEKVKNMVEMRRQLKKKDDELRLLKKKKDAEMEKQLKKKDDELQMLKKKIDNDYELQKLRKQKDEEISKLLHENDYNNATCQNQPWVILPSTMLIMPSSEANMKYLARRQRAKPETFHCAPQLSSRYVTNSPKLVDGMYTVSEFCTRLVDDESITMWPPPPAICVYIGTGTIQDFDNNNWWYAKTTHPEGGLTMLVYYDGKRSQISHGGPGQDVIPLPFSKGVEFITCDYSLSLFNLYPIGMRLGFTYRP
ncbi:hypothetical protein LINPERPRIM_LOCUS39506 [Linum perenne]